MTGLLLREPSGLKLSDIADSLERPTQRVVSDTCDITIDLTGRSLIEIEDTETRKVVELPASGASVVALGDWVGVPSKFLAKLPVDMQEYLLSNMLERASGEVAVTYTEDLTIQDLRSPDVVVFPIRRLIESAIEKMTPDAEIIDWESTPDSFSVDLVVPTNFGRGFAGDSQVGDLTRGGVRFGRNNKKGLAPWVQPYFYRLVCTNGMETFDPGLKMDARGLDVDGVVVEFETLLDRVLGRMDHTITSFYELRSKRLNDPGILLQRLAVEWGLAPRVITRLRTLLDFAGDEVSMFDLINLVTNLANDPSLASGTRRSLQQMGASVVTDHDPRCQYCRSLL